MRITMLGVATVLACTAVLGAQTQQQQDQQQQGQQRQQQQQPAAAAPTAPSTTVTGQAPAGVQTSAQAQTAGSMTFIGCIERGTAPNTFVLSVTEMPPGSVSGQAQVNSGAGAAGTTGASVRGTAGANFVGQRFQLMGGGNLAAHAGHKVQVSGTMASQSSATGAQAQAERRFNVNNVTMLAATCTPSASTPGAAGTTGTLPQPETPQQPEQPPQQRETPQQRDEAPPQKQEQQQQ
jgi:hypothetical protein